MTIGRKTGLALANMALGAILGVVMLYFIGRYFGADANGQFTYAMGVLGLLFFVTDLGVGQAHIKRVSEGRDPGDYFATYAVFKIVATLVFVALAVGFLLVYTVVLGRTFEDTTPVIIGACLFYYVAKALQDIGQSSFEARVETAKAQLTGLLDTLVRFALTAAFTLVLASGLGDGPFASSIPATNPAVAWIRAHPGESLAIASMMGGVVAAVASLTMLARIFERGRFRFAILRDYASFALPLFLGWSISIIASNVDAATLGFFLGKEEAGIFGAIRRIPGVLQAVGAAVGVLLFPTVSRLAATGDMEAVTVNINRSLRYLSMLMMPTVAFVVVFAESIIRIAIGAEFVPGAHALRVLCVYSLVVTLGFAHMSLLMGRGFPHVAARVAVVQAILVVGLNLVLVPYDIKVLGLRLAGLGVLGAALGTLVAGAVWYALLRVSNRRLTGYVEGSHGGRHLVASTAMALALWAADAYVLELVRWFHLPLFVLAGGLVYVGALVAVREFTRDDWRFVRESLHVGEMLRYVRGELRGK